MRSRGRRRSPWRRRARVFFIYLQIGVLLLLAIALGAIGGTFWSVSRLLPSNLDIGEYQSTEATKIISSDGVVLAKIFEENREVVPIEEISEDLRNATIAIEDARFHQHLGVDFRGIARAAYQNIRRGRVVQGGSTITQQLARNIYLTREKKISRKLQEVVLAIQLERHYSKQQILELYLNEVYYGSGAYGVETASRVYFGKHAKDLTLAESALLAGLPQKPSSYSPHENLDLALKRRDRVLDAMLDLGYVTKDQCEKAKTSKPKIVEREQTGLANYKAPWFVTYVIQELTEKYGPDLVYRGGLRVHTTLNYKMQQVAEKELRDHIKKAKWRKVSQGALICIDPHTGYIRAMVGGVNPDFTKDQFNRAVQAKRQPGSAFKAFVYTAAVDSGYDPDYRITNKPITYKGKPWPKNYNSRQSAGSYTMKRAIAESVNIPAVRMTEAIGIDKVITYAKMMGIESHLDPTYSLALGASVVSPLELCSAYGVFATRGVRAEPMAIIKITGSGEREASILEENTPRTRRVLSEQTADTMNEMFRGVVVSRGGTGYAAARVPNSHGKTGTTSDDRDAWFVGFTPELVTTVWAGNDDYSPMKSVWGGNVCAPTWTEFMLKALEIHKTEQAKNNPEPDPTAVEEPRQPREVRQTPSPEDEPKPEPKRQKITICTRSGLRATPACPSTYDVYYDAGSEPIADCPLCGSESNTTNPSATTPPNRPAPGPGRPGTETSASNGYVSVRICVDTGRLANEYCPETIVRTFKADEAPTQVCQKHRQRTD